MIEVSPIRLWIMRAMYLLMAVGLGFSIWPLIVNHTSELSRMSGVVFALLGAVGLLSVLGLRYPLQMIPLLLFELTWKIIWLSAFALPRFLDGTLDEAMMSSVFDTSLGALLLLVIPWRYVYRNYLQKPGDPWALRRPRNATTAAAPAT
jgi:hypothetical protein